MSRSEMIRYVGRRVGGNGLVLLSLLLWIAPVCAQVPKPVSPPAAPAPEVPQDPLGRTTPRGTMLGFLNAARKGEDDRAAQYLNTKTRGDAASTLAHQLFVVLDRRLPAELQKISDKPEGSLADLLKPRQEVVGTVTSDYGTVEIAVERVERGKSEPVWLFSRDTLDAIPAVYEEIETVSVNSLLPAFLVRPRVMGIPLFELVAVFVGLPLLYLTTVLLHRLLSALIGRTARFLLKRPDLPNPEVLVMPARLLIVALAVFATIAKVSLSLLARQFWSSLATVIVIVSCIWLAILWNARLERYVHRRLQRRNNLALSCVVRLVRRAVDVLVVFVGLLIVLHRFHLNVNAALAGLGVGGIAIALAAQKTLENVIGGISIIVDEVVHVGDCLKVGDTTGTVEDIGLRSTRIRTLDRTVVSIPNGQIANLSLENFSRDKFWLHHLVGLRYDTTASQMCTVVESFGSVLTEHPLVERSSVRVRFLRFGTSSLDLEIFAYIFARDYVHFLEIQNELLLHLMEAVQAAGTQIALQTPVLAMSAPVINHDSTAGPRGCAGPALGR
jgi:MscS family membrane protein